MPLRMFYSNHEPQAKAEILKRLGLTGLPPYKAASFASTYVGTTSDMTRMAAGGLLTHEAGGQCVQDVTLSWQTPKRGLPRRSWDDKPCKITNTECIAAYASPFLPSIGLLCLLAWHLLVSSFHSGISGMTASSPEQIRQA